MKGANAKVPPEVWETVAPTGKTLRGEGSKGLHPKTRKPISFDKYYTRIPSTRIFKKWRNKQYFASLNCGLSRGAR